MTARRSTRRVGGGEPDVRLRIGRLVVDADAGAVDREAIVAALERALSERTAGDSASATAARERPPTSVTEALVHAVTARVDSLIGPPVAGDVHPVAAGGARDGVVNRSGLTGVERVGDARPVTGGSARE